MRTYSTLKVRALQHLCGYCTTIRVKNLKIGIIYHHFHRLLDHHLFWFDFISLVFCTFLWFLMHVVTQRVRYLPQLEAIPLHHLLDTSFILIRVLSHIPVHYIHLNHMLIPLLWFILYLECLSFFYFAFTFVLREHFQI